MITSFRMAAIAITVLALLLASQAYWAARAFQFCRKRIASRRKRVAVLAAVYGMYAALVVFNVRGRRPVPVRLELPEALLAGPFQWWIACSFAAFLVAMVLKTGRRAVRAVSPAARDVVTPGRRAFLERAAEVAIGAPFVAGAWGAVEGRLKLEVVEQPVTLGRLPRAFDGFRIAQLSDIHIGPFMTAEQIRKFVDITNGLKPDMIVLTGDFVTWDASTAPAAVAALAGLRAPFGVHGCLGNHDGWARVEDAITALFARAGTGILRGAALPIVSGGEALRLVGVDYQHSGRPGHETLRGVESLLAAGTANILLCHNPDAFPRAAALGIDLMLAGHTHGGQVALEFVSPQIAPPRIVTPFVAGWYREAGSQLYVNRGIGTVGTPIRVGAWPEITVFTLKRGTAG